MPKLVPLLALVTLVSCSALSTTGTGDEPGAGAYQLALLLGQRELDADFEPADQQPMVGLEVTGPLGAGRFGWELGLAGSSDSDRLVASDVDADTGELYGGLRAWLGRGRVRTYLGAGVSSLSVRAEVGGASDDTDASTALYVHGGVLVALSPSIALGLDLRVLGESEIEVRGADSNGDYTQLAFVLAFGF